MRKGLFEFREYHSMKQLKGDVAEYIEFYNHKRFHQTLDYKKPMNVYYDGLKSASIQVDLTAA